MTTPERLTDLANHSELFAPWTGAFTKNDLEDLINTEFGSPSALDQPVSKDEKTFHLEVPKTILHIVSANTPHAAFQSLLRGLVLGSHNRIKLPSAGLPTFEALLPALPPSLNALVETSRDLPPDWLTTAEVLVIFGNDDTVRTLTEQAPATTRVIGHGQRLSIALVLDDPETAATLAATDVCSFDQRGCLSVHDVYVHPDCPTSPETFAALLAEAMAKDVLTSPPSPLTPSEAGAITTLRETARFISASLPEQCQLWESPDSTAWTVIHESHPAIKVSCLNRVAYVKPWPSHDLHTSLGKELQHLACIALHPFSDSFANSLSILNPSRICPLGQTQHPPLTWHQDNHPPLASLTTWHDQPALRSSPRRTGPGHHQTPPA